MAQEKPNRWVEWYLLLREQTPIVRQLLRDWLAAVREEPSLIWQTPAVRYTTYGLGGLMLLLILVRIPAYVALPPSANARPTATTADFHVVCSDLSCGHHFVIHRKFGFRGFPVRCSECDQETGMQARRCSSPTCNGRWVAPTNRDDGSFFCPRCGEPLDVQ